MCTTWIFKAGDERIKQEHFYRRRVQRETEFE
jgi:hypothetical protein